LPDEHPALAVATELRKAIANAVLFNDQVAAEVGMSHSEMQSLHLLQLYGSMTPGRLAALTGLTSGAVTALVDRLERAGLARREPHPTDRRKVVVTADLARIDELLMPYYAGQAQGLARVIESFQPEQLQTIADFFARLNEVRETEIAGA
jgi:DNA-binding MarR family transcriptional regulator